MMTLDTASYTQPLIHSLLHTASYTQTAAQLQPI